MASGTPGRTACDQFSHLQHLQVLDEVLRRHALTLKYVHLRALAGTAVVGHCEDQNVVVHLHGIPRRERCRLLYQRGWESLHNGLKFPIVGLRRAPVAAFRGRSTFSARHAATRRNDERRHERLTLRDILYCGLRKSLLLDSCLEENVDEENRASRVS